MRNVLYLNFDFPPISGPGLWRALGFVKYLPDHGFSSIVLCSDRARRHDHYDETLEGQIPPGTEIRRISSWFEEELARGMTRAVDTIPIGPVRRTLHRIRSRLLREYPDPRFHWAMKAAVLGAWVVAQRRPACMITSGPPHVTHLAGLFIKATTGVPWVMDYRDPWTDDRVQVKQAGHQPWLFDRLEKAAVKRCDAVVAVSPVYLEHLSRRFASVKPANRFHLVRNGHDLQEEWITRSLIPPRNARPHFHFNGTPQTTHPFGLVLDLVDRLRLESPDRPLPLFTFTGMPAGLQEEVDKRGLGEAIRDIGRRSLSECVEYSIQCDVLLAMVDATNPLYRGTIPGKTYEAMALGRHLLALLPRDTTVKELVEECRNGTVADVEDPDDIYAGVIRILDLFGKGLLNTDQDPTLRRDYAARYSRRRQTEELVRVLNSLSLGDR